MIIRNKTYKETYALHAVTALLQIALLHNCVRVKVWQVPSSKHTIEASLESSQQAVHVMNYLLAV